MGTTGRGGRGSQWWAFSRGLRRENGAGTGSSPPCPAVSTHSGLYPEAKRRQEEGSGRRHLRTLRHLRLRPCPWQQAPCHSCSGRTCGQSAPGPRASSTSRAAPRGPATGKTRADGTSGTAPRWSRGRRQLHYPYSA